MSQSKYYVSSELIFFVNGKKVIEANPDPEWTLLYYLRRKLSLYGSKQGCSEGGCGSCTVMVSKYNRQLDQVDHLAVNACLAPVCSMHGLAVTTIEGIGSTRTRLHPVQERIAKAHGSQCGFCTPGIVMSMYTLLRNMPKPSYSDLEVSFQGNLCRCTGYRPILEGYKTFIEDWEHGRITVANGNSNGVCGLGDKCCKNGGSKYEDEEPQDTFNSNKYTPHDPSQEPIFPPELKLNTVYDKQKLVFKGPNVTWHRPTTLEDILKLKDQHNDAKIVTGNTEIGVEVKFKNCCYPVIIMPSRVPELTAITTSEAGITVGAGVTLSDMETKMKALIKNLPSYKTGILKSIVDMLYWFAGKQIRNVASVGGNIMTGSPISDLNPIFMAAGVVLQFRSVNDEKDMIMDHTYFTGYRRNRSNPNHVLISIYIPYTTENQHFKAYKQAKRREDDIAIVNMALNVKLNSNLSIADMNIAFGGMAPVTVSAKKTSQQLIGEKWNEDILEKAFKYLMDGMPLSPSAPGGMVQYRRSLTLSLFFKAYLEISSDLSCDIPERDKSGIGGFKHRVLQSSQYYNISNNKVSTDPVGKPMVHASAIKQATGEAVYCDDMLLAEGELFLALVISSKAHAKIVSIDESEALAMPGVKAFFSAKDLEKEKNLIGILVRDEEIFASEKVQYFGQIIGAVVGTDQNVTQKAAKAVNVVYEELKPIIVTISQAIEAGSYLQEPVKIVKGNVEESFLRADHVVEDVFHMGGQEHFYLETQTARAVPKKEDDEIEIYATCQHPSALNKLVAEVLNIPINRVVTKVKRIGGGFGGKEVQNMMIALPVVIAAHKLQTPVRCALERDEDMIITGGRHPFFAKYKIGFMNNGQIVGLKVEMYINGGYSADVSIAVLERAMTHCENAYSIPNMDLAGHICKTNLHSNTVFRGSGGPQGMLLAETYIRKVAETLNLPSHEVALKNLYKDGDMTHYHQTLTSCTLTQCWNECLTKSNYLHRTQLVEEHNKQNRWKKRGISMVPTKFGVAFSSKCLNQAGALIHVYMDGSVLLTHGGIEMGQGLHTKMIQVASRELGIDQSKIYISETSTDKVPNTSPTAASVSSDINGMAVLNACKQLSERLEPIKKKHPDGDWETWIQKAYLDCISLSAVGYYTTPNIDYNFLKNEGVPYNYFTYGVACSEVEVDCLTGDHQILRTDIVMDVGESINPAIDVGQIEGAFVQGYGLYVMEELIYSPEGEMFSRGPGTYKIPAFSDIPKEFNVALLKGASNPRVIYSSKAVGEPPLFLASSVYFAIREAVIAARKESGAPKEFMFDSPATVAKIRMACEDHITAKFSNPDGAFIPWNIIPQY